MERADYLVVGGGIFGVYTALYLADHNYTVCLLEKESELFSKASTVNQARLHEGYHYPRSLSTALMAHEYKDRFILEHKPYINTQFESYYAIDKSASFTSVLEFENFCRLIQIPAQKIKHHPLIDFNQIEELFLAQEYTFDPMGIAGYYNNRLRTNKNIFLQLNTRIEQAETTNGIWEIKYRLNGHHTINSLQAQAVINATYAGTNGINALFGVRPLELVYKISEMVYIWSPELQHIGLTVMDGPYASIMPYGLSGISSLSSVPYTHHKVSEDHLPVFDCQQDNQHCNPDYLANCNTCAVRPLSHQSLMVQQIKKYFKKDVTMEYLYSLFAIKTKLKSSLADDARPTEISKLHENPSFYCLFSGKINSIYEIEKLIPH